MTAKGDDTDAQQRREIQHREVQPFGTLQKTALALEDNARTQSVAILNQVLADTMTLRDMYKKHHWQISGATFYQLHLLLDRHYEEQVEIVDLIAERIMALGGISVAMGHDVAELTRIARPAKGREDVPTQLARLIDAHEIILRQAHEGASQANQIGDDGTNDLLVSNVIRTNESQSWFMSEHLAAAVPDRPN